MSQFDDEDEIFESDLFDASDVKISFPRTRSRREIIMVLKSESDFNLMKTYLFLKEYVEQMEKSVNIMEAAPETH